MKNLKLKSFLPSLIAIVMLSVFVTSCNKDEIESNEIENQTEYKPFDITPEQKTSAFYLKPAKGFENKTEEEKKRFFEELSIEESKALEENYRISDYLRSKGLLEKAETLLQDGELLSSLDLKSLLSVDQLQKLNIYKTGDNKNPDCFFVYRPGDCIEGPACLPDIRFKQLFLYVCGGGTIPVAYGYFCNVNCIL